MTLKTCQRCEKGFEEIIRDYCRKCYYALKYTGDLSNLEKPEIKSLTKIQKEMLTGTLLGDANLHRNATSKFAHLKIERSSQDLEFLRYQFDVLAPLCKSGCKVYQRKDGGEACYFISRSYEVLDKLYRKWYPNDGKKIVPHDIKLTPLVVAIWFCDDGHIALHHKKQGLLRTTFATNGFTHSDTEWLVDALCKRYKESFFVSKTSIDKQYVINGADTATRVMMKDIEGVFPQSMSRKLKWVVE